MLWWIMAVYWLAVVRVRICVFVSIHGEEGNAAVAVSMPGIRLRRDMRLAAKGTGFPVCVQRRYGEAQHRKTPVQKRVKKLYAKREILLSVFRACSFEEVSFRFRLCDAGLTAITAGFVRALLSALQPCSMARSRCRLLVQAGFSGEGFALHARCIFSFQLGNLMLAAAKAVVKKSRREGFGWKSIPLKA